MKKVIALKRGRMQKMKKFFLKRKKIEKVSIEQEKKQNKKIKSKNSFITKFKTVFSKKQKS